VKKKVLATVIAAALFLTTPPAASADGAAPRLDLMTQAVYDELGVLSEGLVWALREGRFSCLDENGRTAVTPDTLTLACDGETVCDARGFHEGLAVVYGETRAFYIDSRGGQVFSAEWGHSFSDGAAIGRSGGGLVLWEPSGEAETVSLPPEAENADDWDCGILFREGLLPFWVTAGGRELNGYVDTDFNVVIPLRFEDARPFHNGLAPVKEGGKWGFIDRQGRMVIEPQYDGFMASEPDYSHQVFRGGFAAVRKGDKWGFITPSGDALTPFVWDYADQFSGGRAVVGAGGKYGYIDTNGRLVIPLQYDDANRFADGAALAGSGGVYFLIGPGGEPLSQAAWNFEATLASPDAPQTVAYRRGGKWGLLKIGGGPLDSADGWARGHIEQATGKGFVPEALQGSYALPVTRGEFVTLAVRWLEHKTGKSAETLVHERGGPKRTFTDTDDPLILAGADLSITAGISGTLFGPDLPFNRQQAAVMLRKVMDVLGGPAGDAEPYGFTDISDADEWARAAIDTVGGAGIMSGTGAGAKVFSPKTEFSRQESITVFNKMG
jgi:hypothetical protein